jgi:hypothetical protein
MLMDIWAGLSPSTRWILTIRAGGHPEKYTIDGAIEALHSMFELEIFSGDELTMALRDVLRADRKYIRD